MRWIILAVVLTVLAAGGAGAAWFLMQPKPTKYHPEFGTDCPELLTPTTVNAVDCVRVLFGTNREIALEGREPGLAEEADIREVFPKDAQRLQFGRADVWLPKLIEEGGTRDRGETPILMGPPPEEPDELAKYVFLTRITKAGSEAFLTEMDNALASRNADSALLFVHGFNTPFDDALIRSAQLSVDLSRRNIFEVGVPILFSWPSAGDVSLEDYRGDQDRSIGAAPYLEQFLDVITENAGIRRINIVAHSMGNRILTEALESYASDYLERHGRDDLEFRIILVAADVDRDIFEATTGILDNLRANVTIYTSDADRALHVSEIVNSKPRLGDTNGDKPFIRANPYYQTVDATGIATELFGLGHNYYSDNPFILGDIVCALAAANPELRALERRRFGNLPDGLEYFRVSTAVTPPDKDCSLYRTAFPLEDVSDAPEPSLEPAGTRRVPIGRSTPPRERELPEPEAPGDEITPPPPPPPPPAATPPPPTSLPPPAITLPQFTAFLYIANRETILSPAAMAELENALARGPVVRVTVEAHTDGVGDAQANLELSRLWASEVSDFLISRGVSAVLITAEGYGEGRPAVIAEDGVPEPLNQRIEVTFEYSY